jgi:hypothetical protein
MAVSTIGVVLEQSLIDAAAVTKALSERRTLIILDNLESLEGSALAELLTVAKEWSQVGATRLLLTTRDGGLSHADYPAANSRLHQLLPLTGLGDERQPEDALRYFQGLMKLPPEPKWELPKRSALIELFKLVDFHPLSIKLVAYQCKERRVAARGMFWKNSKPSSTVIFRTSAILFTERLRQRFTFIFNLEGFAVVAFTFADIALDIDIGEEVHQRWCLRLVRYRLHTVHL